MKLNIAPDKSPYKTGLNMPAILSMIYLNMDEYSMSIEQTANPYPPVSYTHLRAHET